jgi:endonuclease G
VAAVVRFCRSLVLVVLFLCAAIPAWSAECDRLFAGGLAPTLLNAKLAERTTVLCNDAFAVLASGVTRGPLWSAELLTRRSVAAARATPREGEFHADDRLPLDDRAELADYVRSGYDRGHMAPAGDMPDQAAQQQSFSLANVVPQTPMLNRDLWEGVESAVRHLAERRRSLYVVTGPAYQGTDLQALNGRVLVPTATWKAVYDPVARGAAAYMCSNTTRPRCSTLSILALSRMIGLDPFPAVGDAVKRSAMRLPPPEPSPYASSRRSGHHRKSQPGMFDWLLK